jgi:hypothetical protein
VSRLFLVPEDDKEKGFAICFYIFAGLNFISLLCSFFVKYEPETEKKHAADDQ